MRTTALQQRLFSTSSQHMPHPPDLPPRPLPAAQPQSGWLARLLLPLHLPSQCAICHAWPAARICVDCVRSYAAPRLRCSHCAILLPVAAMPLQALHDEPFCAECLRQSAMPAVDTSLAAVSYQWPWQECIDAFKFGGQPGWASALAGLMAARASITKAVQQCDVLLPIPLHPQRLAKRGYNQSLLLAQALRQLVHSRTGLQRQQAAIHHNWLQRTRHTTPQSLLAPAERQRNMRNAFAVSARHAPQLQGKRVLLLDDVLTTGASAQAAAQVLRAAGAKHIGVVVLARTKKA